MRSCGSQENIEMHKTLHAGSIDLVLGPLNSKGMSPSACATGISCHVSVQMVVSPKRVTTKHVCPTSEICQENKINPA
jgi:hypothetical protein